MGFTAREEERAPGGVDGHGPRPLQPHGPREVPLHDHCAVDQRGEDQEDWPTS